MALIGSIEPFDESKNDFITYVERFEQLLLCNKTEESMKLPLFITLCGGTTFSTLKNLCVLKAPTEKTFKQCIELLKKHYNPEPLVVLERFKFHKRDQKPNEAISEYVVELKKLSRTCSFGTFLSEALRDRFVCGMQSEVIQKKLLSEDNLTFESACKIALSVELASSETKFMHENSFASSSVAVISSTRGNNPSGSQSRGSIDLRRQSSRHTVGGNNNTVNYPKFQNNISTNYELSNNFSKKDSSHSSNTSYPRKTLRPCDRCGRRHDARFCPAVNWVCYACQQVGHTSRVCPAKRRNVNAVLEDDYSTVDNGSDDDFLGENDRISSINGIKTKESYGQVNDNSIFNVTGRKGDENPCFINVKVNKIPMRAEIDTGACASIISSSIFFRHFRNLPISKADRPYKSVTSHIVPVLGKTLVEVEFNDTKRKLEVIIQQSDVETPLLIGRTWLKVLFPSWQDKFQVERAGRLVKLFREQDDHNNIIETYRSRYPLVFSSNPSTIFGYKAGVTIKPNCSPIFCRAYAVPFALRPKVEAEYDKLQKEGVIFPVVSSEWASPVVIVSKKRRRHKNMCGFSCLIE